MTSDDVDRRIRDALAGEPPADQLARLERFWREQSRTQLRRRRRIIAAAAAAVFAVAVGAIALKRASTPGARYDMRVQRPQVRAPLVATAPSGTALSQGRPPTAYEELVFAARTSTSADLEQALLTRLDRATETGPMRMLIIQLGKIGTPRCVPALLSAADEPAVLPSAVEAVERIMGVDGLAHAARNARSFAVQVALIERLLAKASTTAVAEFLALTADSATRSAALAAAGAGALPFDALVKALDSPDQRERFAAAIVLADLGDCTTGEALVARASQPRRASTETWVALLASQRCEVVDQFVEQAARRPHTLSQLNAARVYWARMMP